MPLLKIRTTDKTSIFDSKAPTLANPVNCVGIMGKGLALEFKKRYPNMFADYQSLCRRGELKIGRPCLWRPLDSSKPNILLFPTKNHWREQSRLEDIEAGLLYLKTKYREWNIDDLALPLLGAGLGGLPANNVFRSIFNKLCCRDSSGNPPVNFSIEIFMTVEQHNQIDLSFLRRQPFEAER